MIWVETDIPGIHLLFIISTMMRLEKDIRVVRSPTLAGEGESEAQVKAAKHFTIIIILIIIVLIIIIVIIIRIVIITIMGEIKCFLSLFNHMH